MIQWKGRIPVSIHFFFWITAAIIGFLNSGSLIGTLVWIFVIFLSVLVHEMGHALTAVFFGLNPRVELVALGGLTYHQGDKLSYWKQFLIVLNGPVFGFMLFLTAWVLLKVPALSTGFSGAVLTLFFWVNLIWTILNLVPVMPLDGGQLLRIGLESIFGAKGFRYSLIIGMVVAGSCSVFFFLFQQHFLIGALFFLFAFQSFDLYRRLRNLTNQDRSQDLKSAFEEAERDLQEGRKDKAMFAFERIRHEAKEGMLYTLATQYLAFLKVEFGKEEDAYQLLLPLKESLSPDALCLLHQVAFHRKDFALVEEIGASCFQAMPSKEVALRNALATAALENAKASVGWLETAFQEGLENIGKIVENEEFNAIRSEPLFQQFLKYHLS